MAPSEFSILLRTTRGEFTIRVRRDWSPNGADRLHELVEAGYYNDVAFFRVLDGFVAQFGISGDPAIGAEWKGRPIADDPVKASNTAGTLTYALAGPGTRTTQLFINLADNSRLDSMGFSPVGEVAAGMDVVSSLYGGYGEGAPRGAGPNQARIHSNGNAYLRESFPKLDYVEQATIVEA